MKRKLFTLALIVFICNKSFSQNNKVEYGVNVGLNAANVSADGEQNNSTRTGFNAGISADYYPSDRWSFKVRLGYDQKGWNNGYLTDGSENSYTENYHLDYLTLPVTANWHFGKKRNWYLDFGPYISILMSAKTSPDTYNVKPYFNSVDGGLAYGIGVKIPVSNQLKFFIEIDDQAGFANIAKQSMGGSSFNTSRGALNIGINF